MYSRWNWCNRSMCYSSLWLVYHYYGILMKHSLNTQHSYFTVYHRTVTWAMFLIYALSCCSLIVLAIIMVANLIQSVWFLLVKWCYFMLKILKYVYIIGSSSKFSRGYMGVISWPYNLVMVAQAIKWLGGWRNLAFWYTVNAIFIAAEIQVLSYF